MANEIQKTETTALGAPLTDDVLKSYLKNIGTNLPDALAEQFLNTAKAFGLNPFKREIYAIPYKKKMKNDRGDWVEQTQLSIVTGYETYIRRAERSRLLAGWSVTTQGTLTAKTQKVERWNKMVEETVLSGDLKAIVTIHRKDFEHPFIWEVEWDEYNQKNSMWAEKPKTMLKKVAITQAFRMCFSEQTDGLPYTSDELPEKMGVGEVEQAQPVPGAQSAPATASAPAEPVRRSSRKAQPQVVEAEIVPPVSQEEAPPPHTAEDEPPLPVDHGPDPREEGMVADDQEALKQRLRSQIKPCMNIRTLSECIVQFQKDEQLMTKDHPELSNICLVKKLMIERNEHNGTLGPDGLMWSADLVPCF